jgi:AMP deaminase
LWLVFVAESSQISSSYKRIASVGRINTPRSPGRNTFENADDSDDDGTQLSDDNRIPFYPVTRDSSNSYVRIMIYCLLG